MNVIYLTKNGCIHFKESYIDYEVCWNYIGDAYWKDGYPIINRHNKNWIASRFIWYSLTGRDYRSREVHHKCENRRCINFLHLEEIGKIKHVKYHNNKR